MFKQYKHMKEVKYELRRWYTKLEFDKVSGFDNIKDVICFRTVVKCVDKYYPIYNVLSSADDNYREYMDELSDLRSSLKKNPDFIRLERRYVLDISIYQRHICYPQGHAFIDTLFT